MFGEVLFDVFDGDVEVLGGAPLNVAWHLHGFGLDPLVISARGQDERGETLVDAFRRHGLDRSGLQVVGHPTGVVRATVDDADVHYEIVEDVAYDFIDPDLARRAIEGADVACLVHGSLALRSPTSAEAFRALRDAIDVPVFCDVNLRPPHTPLERVHAVLDGATWVKVSDGELAQLTRRRVSVPSDAAGAGEVLRAEHDLDTVIVTSGADGATAITRDADPLFVPAPVLDDVVDPVGAGDAFASVTIHGWLAGWDMTTILRRAHDFAGVICRKRGAIPDDASIYQSATDAWRQDPR